MGSKTGRRRHVVFVQYGDYRETVLRFAAGGDETYHSQRYSVEHAASLAKDGDVTVICLPAPAGNELLPNGVRAIGLGPYRRSKSLVLCATLERLRPTHLIVVTPHVPAIAWGLVRGARVLPLFADSFAPSGSIRARWERKTLVRLLSSPAISVVANHNLPASLDLAKIGVAPEKIVPWDWPAQNRPEEWPAKRSPDPSAPLRIFFAGAVSEAKGVGDLIRALPPLAAAGRAAELTVAGAGDEAQMRQLAAGLGVEKQVRLLGRVPRTQVFGEMRAHDLVVVPSRHEYAEGLPMTIYEALASRTPLVVSDHPMISRGLAGKPGVTSFRASDPQDLARALLELAGDPRRYEEASLRSAEAWAAIQVPLKRSDLIDHWLHEDREELRRHSLAARPPASA
jgi:glycosyltransferase involved in cell wall biosynthesis